MPPAAAARAVVVLGLANRGPLRDEVYLQVMRQLTRNPTARSVIHSWQLLTMVAAAFPPSRAVSSFVRSFVRSLSKNKNK